MHVNLLMLILRATMPRHFESRNYITGLPEMILKRKEELFSYALG